MLKIVYFHKDMTKFSKNTYTWYITQKYPYIKDDS